MFVAAFFLFISWSKPLRRLSSKRPQSTVFHRGLLFSVAGQFVIHLVTIAYAVSLSEPYAHVDAKIAEVRAHGCGLRAP
jgi:magnesium-transporting ATPase (P-type)